MYSQWVPDLPLMEGQVLLMGADIALMDTVYIRFEGYNRANCSIYTIKVPPGGCKCRKKTGKGSTYMHNSTRKIKAGLIR